MHKNLSLYLAGLSLSIFGFTSCDSGNKPDSEAKTVTVAPAEPSADEILAQEHALFMVAYADSVNAGLREDNAFKGSARREAVANLNGNKVTVNYGSPGKRGRVIWNGLVAYDQVWVSGSHWATAVTFSRPVVVNDVEVEPGMYAFFTVPGREFWEVMLNKNYNQHLADDYAEEDNVVSITTKPINLENTVQRLTYSIEKTGDDSGRIVLEWDEVRIELPFENKLQMAL
ncbi:MAG: DUF2911 domain-containing protein [Luteibaculaceae bacterium]